MKTPNSIVAFTLLLVASGCPPPGSELVGTWTMTIPGLGNIGLNLLSDGSANTFPVQGGEGYLAEPLSWEVRNSQFFLHHDFQDGGFLGSTYIARITSPTSMSGIYIVWDASGADFSGPWTAVKQ